MAITTMDQIAAGLAAAPVIDLFAPSAANVAAGFVNLQRAVVTSTGQMAVPAAASVGGTLHSAGQAGFRNLPDPVGGASRYLAQSALTFQTACSLWFYDRVWSCSGFSGIVATAQAVTSFPVLTRPDANGTGLEIWIECYTATGATAANITVQYTNSDSVAGRSTVSTAHITSMPANRMYRVPLQAGDTGVKSIQSVTLSGTTGTAGSFGVTLMRKIAVTGSAVTNIPVMNDFAALGLPLVQNGTAMNVIHQGTTTSSGIILGVLTFIDG